MQKLVTIYLDSAVYGDGRFRGMPAQDKHGIVEEHLTEELKQGWKIASVNCFGGSADSVSARGWLAVVVEKPDAS